MVAAGTATVKWSEFEAVERCSLNTVTNVESLGLFDYPLHVFQVVPTNVKSKHSFSSAFISCIFL